MREFTGPNAGRYYFAMELPGHVTGLLKVSSARVNHYGYSAFGMPEHVYETVPNPLRYMAREWDPNAGLYYVRNRWYDPEVGRFISEDPIGLAGGINVYAYAANDPINARDPYGLCIGEGYTDHTTCRLDPISTGWIEEPIWPFAIPRDEGTRSGSGSRGSGAGTFGPGGAGGDGAGTPPPPNQCRRAVIAAEFNVALDAATLLGPGALARYGRTALHVGRLSRAQRFSRSSRVQLSMRHHTRFWGMASVHTSSSLTIDGMETMVVDGSPDLTWGDVIKGAIPGVNALNSVVKAGNKCNGW